jgi:YVTN family beta-propeller protein
LEKEEAMRIRRRLPLTRAVVVVAAMGLLGSGGTALAAHVIMAGPQGDGTGVTSYGWSISPAGRQVDLADGTWWADRPYGQGLSPDGRTLLVSSAGASKESVKVVDTASGTVRQTIPYTAPAAVNVGVVWSPDGLKAYISAGGNNKVRTYSYSGGTLTEGASIAVPRYPMGLAISKDGKTLYAAENRGDALAIIDLVSAAVATVPVGHCSEQGSPVNYPSTQPQCQPYGVALSADGATAYVSNWGEESVTPINTATRTAGPKIAVGTHPSALLANPDAARHQLAVANGDSDTVSIIDTHSHAVIRTIDLAPYERAPQGSQPNALAFAPNGTTLYVANAGNNDVDVINLGGDEHPIVGMIPTAWYPSGIDVSPDGRTLYIANAKGLGAGANPGYLQGQYGPPNQYVGSMMHGTLLIVRTPDRGQLERYTEQVIRSNGFDERDGVRVADNEGEHSGSVIPRRVGDPSPIKHVIYIVKENRTYDQVFGDLGKGNGDPNLTLFTDDSAPNIRNLARRFVLLDNYYAASEVSADGWSWSTEATANGYDQKSWPQNYSDVNRGRGYDFEGGNYATAANKNPKDSYLWDRLADKGVSFRNYGFWTVFGTVSPGVVSTPTAPNLLGHTDSNYAGYNLLWADSPLPSPLVHAPDRFTEWQREFAGYVAQPSRFPTVEFVRLPNDHTAGTRAGAPVPKAYVADNDYAVGKLVETVSHSPFWKETAIFVTEDDAQDGPDHVDGHRSEALVISPYTQHSTVDSTFYSTVSMLRTIELIVGINPMTQFDAAATPMLNSFSDRPNLTAYDAVVPSQSVAQVNGAAAPLAAQMEGMSLVKADDLPEQVLNAAIWKSVRGPDSTMPAGDPTGD